MRKRGPRRIPSSHRPRLSSPEPPDPRPRPVLTRLRPMEAHDAIDPLLRVHQELSPANLGPPLRGGESAQRWGRSAGSFVVAGTTTLSFHRIRLHDPSAAERAATTSRLSLLRYTMEITRPLSRQPLSNAQASLAPFEDRLQMLKRATPSWMRLSLLERARQRGDDGKLKAIVRKLPTLSKNGGKGFGNEAGEKGEVVYDLIG